MKGGETFHRTVYHDLKNDSTSMEVLSMSNIIVHDANQAIEAARQMYSIVANMRKEVLQEGVDYGVIPGTDKPTLFKAGAEKLCWALGMRPIFEAESIIEDFDKPLFYYRYRCNLEHIDSGKIVGSGIGSCNSMEDKYGFRWVDASEAPSNHDYPTRTSAVSEFAFAVDKAETTGKYGKPAEYWQAFQDAVDDGRAQQVMRKTRNGNELPAWVIETTQVRLPNENIYSLVNTLDKMAQKRALIAAVLIAAGASEFFTQDIEDMPGFAEVDTPTIQVSKSEPERKVNKSTGEVDGKTPSKRELVYAELVNAEDGAYTGTYEQFESYLMARVKDGNIAKDDSVEDIADALRNDPDFWFEQRDSQLFEFDGGLDGKDGS